MIFKIVKKVVLWGVVLGVAGWLLVGSELGSYVRSSRNAMRSALKQSVPVDFHLKRARDLLDEVGPEMQSNIRLIAQQEVEIGALKKEMVDCEKGLAEQHVRVQKLRECLATSQVSFTFGQVNYSREQLKEELAHSFDRYRDAEAGLAAKRRLLDSRERALVASTQALERVRSRKSALENEIETLAAQQKLLEVASAGTQLSLDTSKLAQTEKLLADVKKELDVTERVLAHEVKFTSPIPIDVIDENALTAAVDSHFASATTRPAEPNAGEAGTIVARAIVPAGK